MRYVLARLDTERREDTYRYYLTDSLYFNGENKHLTVRYIDIVNGKWTPPKEMDGDKIAADVIAKAGLVVKE